MQPVPSGEVSGAADFVCSGGSFLDTEEAKAEFLAQEEVRVREALGLDPEGSIDGKLESGTESAEQSHDVGACAVPASKPYNASGRQLPDLIRLRAQLREGANRF